MSTIRAIYENGVFRPLEPVDLPDGTRVTLQILRVDSDDVADDMEGIYEILDRRHDTGQPDLAARHNEHQP